MSGIFQYPLKQTKTLHCEFVARKLKHVS